MSEQPVMWHGSAILNRDLQRGGFNVSGPLDYNPRHFEGTQLVPATEYFLDNARRAAHDGEFLGGSPPGANGDTDSGSNGGGPAMGVTDGSEALPGEIGEYQVVSNTTGVELGQNIPLTVCSISLTPGDWEIWGTVDFTPPGNVSPNMICASVSVNADALPTNDDLMTGVGVLNMFTTAALTSGERQVLMTGQCRSNSAESLDVHLVAQTTFGGASNSINAKGYICARRVR